MQTIPSYTCAQKLIDSLLTYITSPESLWKVEFLSSINFVHILHILVCYSSSAIYSSIINSFFPLNNKSKIVDIRSANHAVSVQEKKYGHHLYNLHNCAKTCHIMTIYNHSVQIWQKILNKNKIFHAAQ